MQWFARIKAWHVIVALVASLAFNAWFFTAGHYGQMAELGGIPDERFGHGPASQQDFMAGMSDDAADTYRAFVLTDVVYAFLQATWLFGFLAIGTRRWAWLPDWTPWLAVAAMGLDWLENLGFLWLLDSPGPMAAVAVIAQHAKFVTYIASFLAALALLGYYVTHPVKRRRKGRQRATTAAGRRL